MPIDRRCLIEAELRARAAYAEPGRHYHGERHLDDCLVAIAEVSKFDERERRLLRWAILWHDAIYDPGRGDNERRSAELAERELTACGVPEPDAAEVARLIRLTEKHEVDRNDDRGALLVSIDLAILGADPERYFDYAGAVRREYANVSDGEWRVGRSAVLKRLLTGEAIYPEARFEEAFGARARRNMEAELRMLRAG